MQPSSGSTGHPGPRWKDRRTEKRDVSGHLDISGQIEADLPPSLIEEYKASNQATYRREKKRFILEIATFITVVIVGILTVIGVWESMQNTDINRESLQSVQRSYLSMQDIHLSQWPSAPGAQEPQTRWSASVVNDGNTPAVDVVGGFNARSFGQREVTEADFLDLPISQEITVSPKRSIDLGPVMRGLEMTAGIDLRYPPFNQPVHVQKDKIFFWGIVFYRDVFPKTPIHLTEFCWNLSNIAFTKEGQAQPFYGICTSHNCTDMYCSDYKQLIKRLPK